MRSFVAIFAVSVFLFLLNACSTSQKPAPEPVPEISREPARETIPEKAAEPARKNLFVLMPDPDGKTGGIIVANKGGSQMLAKPREATKVKDANVAPSEPFLMEESEIQEIFGAALAAQPERPVRFLLYFRTGTTDLTEESERALREILETINVRPSPEISIIGHTDRLGQREQNYRLGLDRARRIKEVLISRGVPSAPIEIDSHGEDNPLVKTEDEIPEPRNRRVEVTVR